MCSDYEVYGLKKHRLTRSHCICMYTHTSLASVMSSEVGLVTLLIHV